MSSLFSLLPDSAQAPAIRGGESSSSPKAAPASANGFAQLVTDESSAKPLPTPVIAAPSVDYSHFYAFPPGGDALLSAADELTKQGDGRAPEAVRQEAYLSAVLTSKETPSLEGATHARTAENLSASLASKEKPSLDGVTNTPTEEDSSASLAQAENISPRRAPLVVTPDANNIPIADDDLPWKAAPAFMAANTEARAPQTPSRFEAAPSPFRRERELPEVIPAAFRATAQATDAPPPPKTTLVNAVPNALTKNVTPDLHVSDLNTDQAAQGDAGRRSVVTVSLPEPHDSAAFAPSAPTPILKGAVSDSPVLSPAPVIIPHVLAAARASEPSLKRDDAPRVPVPSPFATTAPEIPSIAAPDALTKGAAHPVSYQSEQVPAAPYPTGAFKPLTSAVPAAEADTSEPSAPVLITTEHPTPQPTPTQPRATTPALQAAPAPMRADRRLPDIEAHPDLALPPVLPEALKDLVVGKAFMRPTSAEGTKPEISAPVSNQPTLNRAAPAVSSDVTPPAAAPISDHLLLGEPKEAEQPARQAFADKEPTQTLRPSTPSADAAPAPHHHDARPLPVPELKSQTGEQAALPQRPSVAPPPAATLDVRPLVSAVVPPREAVDQGALPQTETDAPLPPTTAQHPRPAPTLAANEPTTASAAALTETIAPAVPMTANDAAPTEKATSETPPHADVFTRLLHQAAALVTGAGVAAANAAEPAAVAVKQSAAQEAESVAATPAVLLKNAAAPLKSATETASFPESLKAADMTPSLTQGLTPKATPGAPAANQADDTPEAREADVRRLAEALPNAERIIDRAAKQHGGLDALAASVPDPAERAKLSRYAAFLKHHASDESTPSDPSETPSEQERTDVLDTARSAIDAAAALERLGLTDAHPERARLQSAAQPADEGRGKAMLASAGESALSLRLQPEPAAASADAEQGGTEKGDEAEAGFEAMTGTKTPLPRPQARKADAPQAQARETDVRPAQTPEVDAKQTEPTATAPVPPVLSEIIKSAFERRRPEPAPRADEDAAAVHETIRQASARPVEIAAASVAPTQPAVPKASDGADPLNDEEGALTSVAASTTRLHPKRLNPTAKEAPAAEDARPFDPAASAAEPTQAAPMLDAARTVQGSAPRSDAQAAMLMPAAATDEARPEEQTNVMPNPMPNPMPTTEPQPKDGSRNGQNAQAVTDGTPQEGGEQDVKHAFPAARRASVPHEPAKPHEPTPAKANLNDAEQAQALPALFESVFTGDEQGETGHEESDHKGSDHKKSGQISPEAAAIEATPFALAMVQTEQGRAAPTMTTIVQAAPASPQGPEAVPATSFLPEEALKDVSAQPEDGSLVKAKAQGANAPARADEAAMKETPSVPTKKGALTPAVAQPIVKREVNAPEAVQPIIKKEGAAAPEAVQPIIKKEDATEQTSAATMITAPPSAPAPTMEKAKITPDDTEGFVKTAAPSSAKLPEATSTTGSKKPSAKAKITPGDDAKGDTTVTSAQTEAAPAAPQGTNDAQAERRAPKEPSVAGAAHAPAKSDAAADISANTEAAAVPVTPQGTDGAQQPGVSEPSESEPAAQDAAAREPSAPKAEGAAPHAGTHTESHPDVQTVPHAAAHPTNEAATSARAEAAPTPTAGSAFSANALPGTIDAYDANGTPTVYDQIRLQLAAGKLGDGGKLKLQLRPAELGKVEIRMERKNGKASVTISAEKPETLDLLQRSEEALSAFVREAFKAESEKPQLFFADQSKQGAGGSGGQASDGQERRPAREAQVAAGEPNGPADVGESPEPFVPLSASDSMINLKV